ncbi:hypothetical protein MMC17_007007 [Xylographa soralifera]|nr:hypothetical protein [Xylographa soralifera]
MASIMSFTTVIIPNGQRKISSPTGKDRFFGIPRFVYGTAFKGDRSTLLVEQALRIGYVGIDTASVTKNYQEKLVADGVRNVLAEQKLEREDLYVQTKFTPWVEGKDPAYFPYDTKADVRTQIHTSISSSFKNFDMTTIDGALRPVYIDNMTLHDPFPRMQDTLAAWRVLETCVPHQINTLGISNVDLATLKQIYDAVKVKPAVVQNRFAPETGYDIPVRKFCEEHGIVYQPWGVLWGNSKLLESDTITAVAKELDVSKQLALYLCVLSLGKVSMLNGTTNEETMKTDLEALNKFDEWHKGAENQQKWASLIKDFRSLIGEDV